MCRSFEPNLSPLLSISLDNILKESVVNAGDDQNEMCIAVWSITNSCATNYWQTKHSEQRRLIFSSYTKQDHRMTLSLGNLISLVGTYSTILLLFNPAPPVVLGSIFLLHVGLIGPTMMMTLCKIKDGCVSLICPACNPHRFTQLPGGKKWRHFACPFRVLTSGISKIWKKCQIAEVCQDSGIFRYLKFHF